MGGLVGKGLESTEVFHKILIPLETKKNLFLQKKRIHQYIEQG